MDFFEKSRSKKINHNHIINFFAKYFHSCHTVCPRQGGFTAVAHETGGADQTIKLTIGFFLYGYFQYN